MFRSRPQVPGPRGDGLPAGLRRLLALAAVAGLAVFAARNLPDKQTRPGGSTVVAQQASSAALPASGEWQHQISTSALDDSSAHVFRLLSSDRSPNSIGIPMRAEMQVICLKNETRLIIDINDYMGMDPVPAAFRIDRKPLRRERASVSADGKVFGWWNGSGVPILKAMRGAKSFVVAASPWGHGAKEAVFDITGIDAVLDTIGKACRWK